MSLLLAALTQVAASPSPVPTITPEAVAPVIQYVTPEWVNQLGEAIKDLAQLALIVVPAWLASWTQSVVRETKDGFKRFGSTVNVLLLFGYSFVIGLVGLVASAQLDLTKVDFTDPAQVGTAILAAIGAATIQYNRYKAKHGSPEPAPTKTAPAAGDQLQAAE